MSKKFRRNKKKYKNCEFIYNYRDKIHHRLRLLNLEDKEKEKFKHFIPQSFISGISRYNVENLFKERKIIFGEYDHHYGVRLFKKDTGEPQEFLILKEYVKIIRRNNVKD